MSTYVQPCMRSVVSRSRNIPHGDGGFTFASKHYAHLRKGQTIDDHTAYELMNDIYQQVKHGLSRMASFPGYSRSRAVLALIDSLLQVCPSKRLGAKRNRFHWHLYHSLRNHEWFTTPCAPSRTGIDWQRFEMKSLTPNSEHRCRICQQATSI